MGLGQFAVDMDRAFSKTRQRNVHVSMAIEELHAAMHVPGTSMAQCVGAKECVQ